MEKQFWTTKQLHSMGYGPNDLTEAVKSGQFLRLRNGHYCSPDAPEPLVRVVRIGGHATSTTATTAMGIWTPPDTRLHVALKHNASRRRSPEARRIPFAQRDDVCIHWTSRVGIAAGADPLCAPLVVLEHAMHCQRPEFALAMVDSALFQRHIRPTDIELLRASLPAHLASLLDFASGTCESGLETIASYLLRVAGFSVLTQVNLVGIGRVDLLIEGRLIVEVDGRAWHDDPAAFERDRRRDAEAARQHYRTLRFTYAQILFDWPAVEAAIRAALAA